MGIGSTGALRDVLRAARSEAYRNGQLVEPSHLLLAMMRVPDNGARRFIRRLAAARELEAALARLVMAEPAQSDGVPPKKKVPLSSATKTAFELSIEDVMSRDNCWTTVDVLLGILRHGSSPTAQLLNDHGLTLEATEALSLSPRVSER